MALTIKPKKQDTKVSVAECFVRRSELIVKLVVDIIIINASMSNVKVNEKLTDRKPKGCFVKKFFEAIFKP